MYEIKNNRTNTFSLKKKLLNLSHHQLSTSLLKSGKPVELYAPLPMLDQTPQQGA